MKIKFTSLTIIFLLLFSVITNAQKLDIKTTSDFFTQEKTKVLVVGTFHFDYPNLDAAKTKDKDQIDVLSSTKQKEIIELTEYIKRFKPTKIAIEAWNSFNATEKLRAYKNGEYQNERSERFQLGMRIANDLNLDTLYSIDAESLDNDLYQRDSIFVNNLYQDYDYKSDDSIIKVFDEWYEYTGKLPVKMNLLEYFKYINARENHNYEFGAYLVGDFKLDNNRGADVLAVSWYDRNLRIFRNIQKITQNEKDRILVIFGNGHAAILRQLIESSPEFEFIEFDSL